MDTALSRAVAGDTQAWVELVTTHAPSMRAAASRVVGAAAADDAVQDALVQAWHHGHRFVPQGDPDSALRGWLVRITVHAALARRRRDHREQECPMTTVGTPAEPAAQDQAFARVALADLLADLPERHRSALELHYLAGLDHQELAGTWRCSPGAARVRVHRALAVARTRAAGAAALGLLLMPIATLGASGSPSWQVPPSGPAPAPIPHLTGAGFSAAASITLVAAAGALVAGLTLLPATTPGASSTATAATISASAPALSWQALPCGPCSDTISIAQVGDVIAQVTGKPVKLTTVDANGVRRDGMSFAIGPIATLGDLQRSVSGYWIIGEQVDGFHIDPVPVPTGRASERERLLAFAYTPITLRVDGMSLAELGALVGAQLGMPVRIEAQAGVLPEAPIVSGEINHQPIREGIGKLVSNGNWEVDYQSLPGGVVMRLVARRPQAAAGVN